jgi:predicted signal transduction protein with EAL and GGDEF domain
VRDVDGHAVTVGASIGLAFYPADARTLELLVMSADQAMYAAKHAARAPPAATGAPLAADHAS